MYGRYAIAHVTKDKRGPASAKAASDLAAVIRCSRRIGLVAGTVNPKPGD